MYSGNIIIPIEVFGSVDITVKTLKGPAIIELSDMALVPSFHTNIVLDRKFKANKVYWDQEIDCLIYKEKIFCYVEDYYNQWTLKYNEPAEARLVQNTAIPIPILESIPGSIPPISTP